MSKKYLLLYNFFFNYPTPSNLTYLWNFGVVSFFFFIIQLVTGLILSMYYFPYDVTAFLSVENIMREVEYGWLIRYAHSNGASFFFFFVFLHIFRNLYFFSFLTPKYQIWNIGVLIFVLMIVAAFTGYVLPWGQMSFWAATVITNLFSAIPIFGDYIIVWLWGSYSVGGSTLNRFFSFHFIIPLIIFVLVVAHFLFLHEVGSCNNLKISKTNDKIMFHPYFTFKDFFVILIIFVFFFVFVGFAPNYLSHPDNYIPADPLITPAHIVPEWYFLLFYAMLRSVPSKLGGVLILFASILILFIFPLFIKFFFRVNIWENEKFEMYGEKLKNDSISFRNYNDSLILWRKTVMHENVHRIMFFFFFFTFVVLSILGSKPVEFPYLVMGRFFTFFYFFYFIFNLYYFYFLSSVTFIRFYLNIFKSYFYFIKNFFSFKNLIIFYFLIYLLWLVVLFYSLSCFFLNNIVII